MENRALLRDCCEQMGVSLGEKETEQFKKLEGRLLPMELDYETIQGLRLEARQKLNLVRPENLGQASRITGVSPADISVLLIYMEQMKRKH